MNCFSKDMKDLDDLRRRTLDMRKDLQARRADLLASVFTDSRGGHDVDWGTKQCRDSSKVNTNAEQMQCMMLLGMADTILAVMPLMQEILCEMRRVLVLGNAAV